MKTATFTFAIIVFISIYGGFHYYAYRKLATLFPQHPIFIVTGLALLGCSIFVVVLFTHGNIVNRFAEPIAFISFWWMGIVFLFFVFSVPIDVLARISGISGNSQIHAGLISPWRTIIVGIVVLFLSGYGYLASQRIHIETFSLTSPKIIEPIRIVQISDLHLGLLSNEQYFQKVVAEINSLDADIIVCTGDLVDMQMDHLDVLGKIMSGLKAWHGKFAVYGNHEALAGLQASRSFTEGIGFTLLSNIGTTIDDAINLVGVDDPAVEGRFQSSSVNEPDLLQQYDNGLYTILLKHQPSVEQASIGLFDLQLSGHTHGGQIFPFGLLIHLFYKAPFGLSQLKSNGWLYVSRGTGTWGPPMRVLAPPEITLIQLQPLTNK